MDTEYVYDFAGSDEGRTQIATGFTLDAVMGLKDDSVGKIHSSLLSTLAMKLLSGLRYTNPSCVVPGFLSSGKNPCRYFPASHSKSSGFLYCDSGTHTVESKDV